MLHTRGRDLGIPRTYQLSVDSPPFHLYPVQMVFKTSKGVSLTCANQAPNESDYDDIVATYQDIHDKLEAGERVYIGYPEGERAGSIGFIKELECDMDQIIPTVRNSSYYSTRPDGTWICHAGFHAKIGWDKRRNVVKCYIGHGKVYFPNFKGPTVWEKFDKKAAEKEATDARIVIDRDGKVINVGDRVLYINARYGGAAQLDRGIITDIKVKVKKIRSQTYADLNVYIDNDDGDKSKITGPDKTVLKL